MATKKERDARLAELEAELATAIEAIGSATEIIVSLNKIIISQNEIIITNPDAITQQVENKPIGLSDVQMARLVKTFKAFPKQRWVKERYLELRAEGKKKGKAIKTIVKETKTPEMRNQFGTAYHSDYIRQVILKGMK